MDQSPVNSSTSTPVPPLNPASPSKVNPKDASELLGLKKTETSWVEEAKSQIEQDTLAANILSLDSKVMPDRSQLYVVLIYVLSNEIDQHGNHGVIFIEGTYPRLDMASKKAKEISRNTGMPNVYVFPTCKLQLLNTKNPSASIKTSVVETVKMEADRLEKQEKIRQHKEIIERKNLENAIDKDRAAVKTPESIEHYRSKWQEYLVLKSLQERLFKQLRENKELVQQAKQKIQESNKLYPSHEANWIAETEKLTQITGDNELLISLTNRWKKHR